MEGHCVASGAGGRCPSEPLGRNVSYSCSHRSISTFAFIAVWKISPFSNSSRSFPLNDLVHPFSRVLRGSVKRVQVAD
jgi:hypothetical protein